MRVTIAIDLDDLSVAALSVLCRALGRHDLATDASDNDRAAHVVNIVAVSFLTRSIGAMRAAYLAGNHDLREWAGAEPVQDRSGTERESGE